MRETGHAAPCFTCRTASYTEMRLKPRRQGEPVRLYVKCDGCGASGPVGATREQAGELWADRQRELNDGMYGRER